MFSYNEMGLTFIKNNISELQIDILQSLLEQGIAEELNEKFSISWSNLLSAYDDLNGLLDLPTLFSGDIYVNFQSTTSNNDFDINWGLELNRREIYPTIKGAIIENGKDTYLMSAPLFNAINAILEHKKKEKKPEEDNLYLMYALENASKQGLKINLKHFNNFEFIIPEKVSLFVEQDFEGNLILTPNLGISEDPSEVRKRLHQIERNAKSSSLRIKKQIVIIDETKRQAIEEIAKVRKIDKSIAPDFLNNPTSYISGTSIDLDSGFSARVLGVTEFVHAYFGDQEKSANKWFEANANKITRIVHEIPYIQDVIKNVEDLEDFKAVYKDAEATNSEVVTFKDLDFNIKNKDEVKAIINECSMNINLGKTSEIEKLKALVLDVQKNDDELEYSSDILQAENLYKGEIDISAYKRSFYPHQNEGVRWILAHAMHAINDNNTGCLLADDMGLGKTFMTIVAIREYLIKFKEKYGSTPPVLVVAPVALLEGWEEEIQKTYKENFFNNIVLLTSNGELKKYIKSGCSKELRYPTETEDEYSGIGLENIRYSLKIGEEYGNQRLDAENTIVLTNYETLRDYQASFGLINWSMIVFDEMQYIKNPNTRASVAAKALKSKFKLAVTGTPVENSLKDIWNIFDVINSGLLDSYQNFRDEFISPILKNDSDIDTKNKLGQKLRTKIGNYMLRRNKEDKLPDLPSKIIFSGVKSNFPNIVYDDGLSLPMSNAQEELYQNALNEYANATNKPKAALQTLHKLRQICLFPALDKNIELEIPISIKDVNNLFERSSKLIHLQRILDNIRTKNEKVIIFLINKKLQEVLKHSLKIIYGINVSVVNGDSPNITTSTVNPSRKKMIANFEDKDGFNIIIMSPLAAGVGLTVTGANNVIHLERHWNPAKEAQATDRVYRIGQKKDVNIYVPVCKYSQGKSFDEILDALLSRKIDLNKSIVTPNEFSEEDLAEIMQ